MQTDLKEYLSNFQNSWQWKDTIIWPFNKTKNYDGFYF